MAAAHQEAASLLFLMDRRAGLRGMPVRSVAGGTWVHLQMLQGLVRATKRGSQRRLSRLRGFPAARRVPVGDGCLSPPQQRAGSQTPAAPGLGPRPQRQVSAPLMIREPILLLLLPSHAEEAKQTR